MSGGEALKRKREVVESVASSVSMSSAAEEGDEEKMLNNILNSDTVSLEMKFFVKSLHRQAKRVDQLYEQVCSLSREVIELRKNGTPSSGSTEKIEDLLEKKERERSIVVINMQESLFSNPSARVEDDEKKVATVLDFLGIECRPISVYRMGRHLPRKLKVVLPSSSHQKLALKNSPALKQFPYQNNLYLRASMSVEDRKRNWEAHKARKSTLRKDSQPSIQGQGAVVPPYQQYGPPPQRTLPGGNGSQNYQYTQAQSQYGNPQTLN